MSTKWMKLLIGAGITASILSLNGCGGSDNATAAPATVSFGFAPSAGPFSNITSIRAMSLTTSSATPISVSATKLATGSFKVTIPLANIKTSQSIVLQADGDFSGDILLSGNNASVDTTSRTITNFTRVIDKADLPIVETSTVSQDLTSSVVIPATIADHLASVVTLANNNLVSAEGAFVTSNSNAGASTVANSFAVEKLAIGEALGVTVSPFTTTDTSYRANLKYAEKGFASKMLKAFTATNSGFSAFSGYFSTLTKSIISNRNDVGSVLASASSTLVPAFSEAERNAVTAAISANITGIETNGVDPSFFTTPTYTPVLKRGINLSLMNFPKMDTIYFRNSSSGYPVYSVNAQVTLSGAQSSVPVTYSFVRDIRDGVYKLVDPAFAGNQSSRRYDTLASHILSSGTTNSLFLPVRGYYKTNASTTSADLSAATTNFAINSLVVSSPFYFSLISAALNPEDGQSALASGATSSFPLIASPSESVASFVLATPTNRDLAIAGVTSANGVWLTTDSSFTNQVTSGASIVDGAVTGHNNRLQAVIQTNETKVKLGSDEAGYTRGHLGNPSSVWGADFVYTQQAISFNANTVLNNGSYRAYLVATDVQNFRSDVFELSPKLVPHLAFGTVMLNQGSESVTKAVSSVPMADRLKLKAQITDSTLQIRETTHLMPLAVGESIRVRNHEDNLVIADHGLRYGHYMLSIKTQNPTTAAFAHYFSVDAQGRIWDHGGANDTALGRYRGVQIGDVATGINLSMGSSNISTVGFTGSLNGNSCDRTNSARVNCVVDQPSTADITAAVTALRTQTDVLVALHRTYPEELRTISTPQNSPATYYPYLMNHYPVLQAKSGTALASSTTAMFGAELTDWTTNLSFIMATVTDSDSNNGTSGFWLVPHAPGTSSSALSYRLTDGFNNLSAEFTNNVLGEVVLCRMNGETPTICFSDLDDLHGENRIYGYSPFGFEIVNAGSQKPIGPQNLKSGNAKLSLQWIPFQVKTSFGDVNADFGGITIKEATIEADSGSITIDSNFSKPTVTLQ